MSITRGLWIDDHASRVARSDYWDSFRRLGFRTAAFMLESVGAGFDPRYTERELDAVVAVTRKYDIEVVLTIWPEPRRRYLDELAVKLPRLVDVAGAAAVESDAESNWTPRRVEGFEDIDEASDAFDAFFDQDFGLKRDVRIELTTFTEHRENGPRAALARHADVVLPQAYSVRIRKDAQGRPILIEWDHPYGPGKMQRRTLGLAQQIPKTNGKPALAAGLAAYDQGWPGRTNVEAMTAAYDATCAFAPREIRWWSSKWIIGAMRTSYARTFFENLVARGL